ncbi:MAG: alpha/beta hydrolase [Actinomyces sp.]|nr:MAG: alpha/beta hydrolase [Actinomyces sp.]
MTTPPWDAELEAARAEMREFLALFPTLDEEYPADPLERAAVMREGIQRLAPFEPVPTAEVATVPGPAGDIGVRIHRPDGPARSVIVHLHGGGWVVGDPVMNDRANAADAEAGHAVVSVDYRLAPEHPWPAGPDDCEAVARWVLEHGPELFGSDRLVLAGESAGAHLAAVTALRLFASGDADPTRLVGVDLVYGVHDLTGTPSWTDDPRRPDVLTGETMHWFVEAFTPGWTVEERRRPDVSPLWADWRGFRPAVRLSVGTGDHLYCDTAFLAARLVADGVDHTYEVYPDAPHAFQLFGTRMAAVWVERRRRWLEEVTA